MKKLTVILVLFSFLFPQQIFSQTGSERLKAVFIYNFVKQVQWSNSENFLNFQIGVVGNSPIVEVLSQVTAGKTVYNKQIIVRSFRNVSEISNVQILYVPFSASARIDEILLKLNNSQTLIVTERTGMIENGACINFSIQDQKLGFEISKTNLKKHKLTATQQLFDLALKVYD